MTRVNLVPQRRLSLRLQGYDYTLPGAYFVTVCTYSRRCLFGEIVGNEMGTNDLGQIVLECWEEIPRHYAAVTLDAFVVMPNHVHGIIMLRDVHDPATKPKHSTDVGAGFKPAPTAARRAPLSEIVRALKTFSARRINELRLTHGAPVWQRNYYEHIIRTERDLDIIRRYIVNNPLGWALDDENPDRVDRSRAVPRFVQR